MLSTCSQQDARFFTVLVTDPSLTSRHKKIDCVDGLPLSVVVQAPALACLHFCTLGVGPSLKIIMEGRVSGKTFRL